MAAAMMLSRSPDSSGAGESGPVLNETSSIAGTRSYRRHEALVSDEGVEGHT